MFVGVAGEYQDEYNRGDFLIRNILGADRDAGILAIGDTVRTGQTIQFQIRDAEFASEDLKELLTPHADSVSQERSC